MRLSRGVRVSVLVMLLVAWGLTWWAYPRMPAQMVTHWGLAGQPNDWMPRLWGTLIGPLTLTILALLYFGLIPAIEPWRENLQRFWEVYTQTGLALLLFLLLLHGYTIAWNLGYLWDIRRFIGVLMGLLFAALARLLLHARPNWFIGIRTPWTLSSPWVWRQVHRHGAYTLAAIALLWLLGALWPFLLTVALAATLLWAVGLIAYSYWLYQRKARAGAP